MKRKRNKNLNYKLAKIMEYDLSDEDIYVLETVYGGDIDRFAKEAGLEY